MRLCSCLFLATVGLASVASATTWVVDINGTGDFTAIGPAVSASSEGDTVLVLPGIYTGEDNENIAGSHSEDFVLLADTTTRQPVVIDGGGTSMCFNFNSGQTAATIVDGFTIQNGYGQGGGGIRMTGSSPTVSNCFFVGNQAFARGGAVYASDSSCVISNCIFRHNSAVTAGGAVYSEYGSSAIIVDCLFDENETTGPGLRGGAVYCSEGSEMITYCTIVENGPDQVKVANGIGVDVVHCVIAGASEGVGIVASPPDGAFIEKSGLFGNAGGDVPQCDHDNIVYDDPLFCDPDSDDYSVCEDSFTRPSNNIWGIQIGYGREGCPPCGSPVENATWGALKELFR